MKANELRIGNWILTSFLDEEHLMIISEIGEFSVVCENKETDAQCGFKVIYPIPLTEEWLVKFGAEKVNEISEYFDGEDMYSYELYLDGAECLFDRKCNCQPYEHIKYVHQLQNLYFALTGEELKQNVTENV